MCVVKQERLDRLIQYQLQLIYHVKRAPGVIVFVEWLLNLCFRLRCLVKQLERGEASLNDLKKNLEYAASVLESVYIEETR